MSLNISKLEHIRTNGAKTTARCPACAEAGHDRKGEHLVMNEDGGFGCVVYPGDSGDAKEHRKRIFALCGDRELKPLIVSSPSVGRVGRVNQSQSAPPPLKTGLLGRLGRVFQTHLGGDRQSTEDKKHPAERQLNECKKGVLSVLNDSSTRLDRPLTKHELAVLMRACGIDDIILEGRRLFNATIVGIERHR